MLICNEFTQYNCSSVSKESKNRVDVLIGGDLFTAYIWLENIKKG